jgi:hypothetical protein
MTNTEIRALKARVEDLERILAKHGIAEPVETTDITLESQWAMESGGPLTKVTLNSPDADGDLCIHVLDGAAGAYTWIRKEQAQEIIDHLKRVFGI